jgi:hypothetical protein
MNINNIYNNNNGDNIDNDIDIELLNKALENDKNDEIIHLTFQKIQNHKFKLFHFLNITNENIIIKLNTQLKNYIYIDTIDKLKTGNYIRWLNDNIDYNDYNDYNAHKNDLLNKGGFLKEINIGKKNNINLIIKGLYSKNFTINFNEIHIFKKITNQENIILQTLQYLHT